MEEVPKFINKNDIEYEKLYTKGGTPIEAVRKSKVEALRAHQWDCSYITNDYKCSKCGTEIPYYPDGTRAATEDISACWFCGAEMV